MSMARLVLSTFHFHQLTARKCCETAWRTTAHCSPNSIWKLALPRTPFMRWNSGRSPAQESTHEIHNSTFLGIDEDADGTLQKVLQPTPRKQRYKLVIFDKNGTLINFHALWTPWIQGLAQRIESATGLELEEKIYNKLDFCIFAKKARSGILAQGTTWQIKLHLEDLLCSEGLHRRQAQYTIESCWQDCDTNDSQTVKAAKDLHNLFSELRSLDIKIAVCTSDNRSSTRRTLEKLKLLSSVDMLVCGDDVSVVPKPSSHSVTHICKKLGVDTSATAVIGDTQADMIMGRSSNAGAVIGVLTGIGTRLELSKKATHIVDSVIDALPILMGQEAIPTVQQVVAKSTDDHLPGKKASLVIFDKDGTLICFHSMWTPWAKELVSRLEEATGLSLHNKIFTELGYCHDTESWKPGLLAEGTTVQNKERIQSMLGEEGLSDDEAEKVLEKVWFDGDSQKKDYLKTLHNLNALFSSLKQYGIKTAICTADSRAATEQFVKKLDLADSVDMLVCGDDEDSKPKPSPYNALKICKKLGVDPSEAVVVGDTLADLGMGKSAKLGATVGVLSGVGKVKDLEGKADHLLSSIRQLLPIVIRKSDKDV